MVGEYPNFGRPFLGCIEAGFAIRRSFCNIRLRSARLTRFCTAPNPTFLVFLLALKFRWIFCILVNFEKLDFHICFLVKHCGFSKKMPEKGAIQDSCLQSLSHKFRKSLYTSIHYITKKTIHFRKKDGNSCRIVAWKKPPSTSSRQVPK